MTNLAADDKSIIAQHIDPVTAFSLVQKHLEIRYKYIGDQNQPI